MNVVLPQLIKGMDEAIVVSKLKRSGDYVQSGEPILEVETEKAIVSIQSPLTGVIDRFDCQEDQTVPVGASLFWVESAGELEQQNRETRIERRDNVSELEMRNVNLSNEMASNYSQMSALSTQQTRMAAGAETTAPQALYASPSMYPNSTESVSARSGRPVGYASQSSHGRVSEPAFTPRVVTCDYQNSDCEQHSEDRSEFGNQNARNDRMDTIDASVNSFPTPRIFNMVEMSSLRRTISRRMSLSAQTIPASVLYRKADVSELIKMRLKINRFSNAKASLNDYFIKATAMALADMPEINSSLDGDQIIQYADVNIGMAVDAKGSLFVPVIRQAQKMQILDIAAQTKLLIEKAEQGKLTLEEMANPTFTISNMGALGVEYFTPIILPPQSGILGIGAVMDEPVEKDGKWETRKKVGLSYAFDHRIIDGALASKFFKKVIEFLEEPLLLIWKE